MAKLSKQCVYFEQLCKEIELFKTKVLECEKEQQARVKILKPKVNEYEVRLSEAFGKLTGKENEDYIDMYLRYKEIILDLLVNLEEKTEVNVITPDNRTESNTVPDVKQSFVKLPNFEIPYFYGDTESWLSFKELFNSSILQNKSLGEVEKMQYMNAYIRGNAAKLIRGFSLKPENLTHCWEILCNRYENKRLLALSQINKIFSIKVSHVKDSKSFLNLIDTCNEAIRNLKTLGLESNALSDLVFINFLMTKFDSAVRQRWELSLDGGDSIPDLNSFKKFVEREARSLDDVSNSSRTESRSGAIGKNFESKGKKNSSINNSLTVKDNKCVLCLQPHQLFKCPKFGKMNVHERWNFIKSKSLCQNCLRSNHSVKDCRISIKCKACSLPHHTSLHIYKPSLADHVQGESRELVSNSSQSTNVKEDFNVLLSTALINIKSPNGKTIQCRALIDNASQNSLISNKCAKMLNLPLVNSTHQLIGINGLVAETCLRYTTLEFSPYFSKQYQPLTALVVNKVTAPLPNFQLRATAWPHIAQLQLADPNYHDSSDIDILLGADVYGDLIYGPPIHGNPGEPCAIPSMLGYLLIGRINFKQEKSPKTLVSCHSLDLETFFEHESVPHYEKLESSCTKDPAELIYAETTTRNEDGRYVVQLPLKENCILGDSAAYAFQAFKHLERKFSNNPQLKQAYSAFMAEYSELAHMSLVKLEELNICPNYYLPHHAVTNENSSTTKLRVVYNASAKTSNGVSLNTILHKGPKLQTSIFDNLLRFRLNKIALSSDIEKMFRQILVSDRHTHFQRIFWRANSADPIFVYKLNTVTYGTSCAPFLALRTIRQLLDDEQHNYPNAVKAAKDHMYMDDFLGGADSINAAKALVLELQNLFKAGGFHLRKWASNCPEAIEHLPDLCKSNTKTHSFNPDSAQRILGLEWNLEADTLRVQVSEEEIVKTKRQLLSIIARIFDPLGLLSPATVVLKLLLQDVWKANLSWDDPLPLTILERWQQFYSEINSFKTMSIPRFIKIDIPEVVQLHCFCDASPKAYAAVIYLKTLLDTPQITLVAAKTRIAPLNSITLPKLELCSALLLSELVSVVKNVLPFSIKETFLWTDSTIALSWIQNPPAKGNQFVLHRANKIRSLTPTTDWHHLPGKYNPADYATRGLYPRQLQSCEAWWLGPDWLHDSSNPPSSATLSISTNYSECQENNNPVVDKPAVEQWDLLTRFSSYSKLLRVLAWIKRFLYNSQSEHKLKGPLTATELSNSSKSVVKLIQKAEFASEISMLKNNKPLNKSSKLLQLNVFLDSDSILRVGGRLKKNQTLSFDAKHQIILPKTHPVTSAIIRHFHNQSLHGGTELVLSLIRQKFWILDGRSTVKRELRKCLSCIRTFAKPISQIMGDLPASRITPSRPFQHVGIDYAGPINTKCQHKRKSTIFKSYICLFVCMSTKAVHIEVVSELTTEAFLQTLKRFISRRGVPSDIYSDNGRNFLGASSYLKTIHRLAQDECIQNYSANWNISWHFIPPYSPNFGGLWESAIKLAKRHMFRITRNSLLTFEELTTLLCSVEACMNSRPLIPLSTDPDDLQSLTPGHFLIGAPLLQLPLISDTHATNQSVSFTCRWNLLKRLHQQFWDHWTMQYLNSLTSRQKRRAGHIALNCGDLVLIKENSTLPGHWNLGRIVEVHPGSDGVVRVATIQTAQGLIKRSVQHISKVVPDTSAPPEDVEKDSQSCQEMAASQINKNI